MKNFTIHERNMIEEYFGVLLENLDKETFTKKQKELKKMYHPDRVSKYNDKSIEEVFKTKFQELESLCDKIQKHLAEENLNDSNQKTEPYKKENAQFSYERLSIDIITSNLDLKYILFGSNYRWLVRGDRYKIPKTKSAYINIEADYSGRSVGFKETIKLLLTFGIDDPVEVIVEWLFINIYGQASFLIIEKEKVNIDYFEMLMHIRKTTFIKLESKNS